MIPKTVLKRAWPLIGLWFVASQAFAQQSFSLQEAISYGIQKNVTVKNAEVDAESANSRIGEIRSIGLPQVNGSLNLLHNPIIQRFFLPATFGNPNAGPDDPPIAAKFGVNYSGTASVTVNQLLFNATWLLGLKAAEAYRSLAQKQIMQSKLAVVENVSKAYYGVLIAEERAKILNLNIGRLDSLVRETRILNQNGFVEKIDIDRLEVQVNNLKTERQKVQNLVELSYYLLKFQMGIKLDEPIALADRITEQNVALIQRDMLNQERNFNYNDRIEYSLLKDQKNLAEMDVTNVRRQYLPTVAAFGTYGYNIGLDKFKIFTNPWFNSATVGLAFQVPIFDGFQKKYKLQQNQFTVKKIDQSMGLLEQSIDLQVKSASVGITNGLETLKTQKRNLELSQEIVRVSKIKYKSGTGSNIEVLNAESSLKESQTNYFAALYDLLLSKVDLDKARGQLLLK